MLTQQEDGNWIRVDEISLMYPIVPNNHAHIFRREFSLTDRLESGDRFFYRILLNLSILRNRNANELEKEKTRNWLKGRLKNQGFTGNVLKIVQKEEVISILTGEVLSEDIYDEKVLYLD